MVIARFTQNKPASSCPKSGAPFGIASRIQRLTAPVTTAYDSNVRCNPLMCAIGRA